MRAVVVSQHYLEPAHRGRLRALAGLGCEVIAGVPDRWEVQPGVIARPEWAPDGSVQIAPLPVTGNVDDPTAFRSEEHTSELQSRENLVCRLLLEKKNS